jgi:uncharacterized protein (DUF4415 family)
LQFTWDERKNRANQRKHGVSFETATLVFDDPYHLSTQDREVEGELRWQTVGVVKGKQILLVAHTLSESVNEGDEEVSASSRREKRHPRSEASMPKASKTPRNKRASARSLTPRQKRELAALATLPDDQIDTSDIPELPPTAWKDAVRGRFYRPVKQAVSLRLDADVVAWLKKPGKGYQTRANYILRERMLAQGKKVRA